MCFASRGNLPDPLGTVPREMRFASRDHRPDPLGTVPSGKCFASKKHGPDSLGTVPREMCFASKKHRSGWGQSPWDGSAGDSPRGIIFASVDHCSKLQGTVPVRWGWRGSVFDGCGGVIALWLVRASTAGICARFPVGHSGGRSVARSKRCQQLAVIMSAAMAAAQVPVIAPNK